MTKNDITRGLIDFAVSQCLKNIKEDPYRSIRRLADLGRQFAKGRFQEELFSLFQRLLLNEDGPYYEMLKQLVSSVDTDSLKTLGINIGYNSWTCGASRLRQITAEKDYPHWLAEISLSPESSASQLKEQLSAALKNGTYAFRLHMPAQSITTDTRQLGLIREFPDCSFFLDFMDTDCTYSDDLLELTCSCDNLAFLVPFGSLQSRQLVDLLNARQRIYGVCRTYDNTNAAERISDSQISEMLSWGSPLLFFLAAADTTQDNRLLVDNAILDARLHQTYPALLIHLDADVARIQQLLISSRKNLRNNRMHAPLLYESADLPFHQKSVCSVGFPKKPQSIHFSFPIFKLLYSAKSESHSACRLPPQ